MSFQYSSPPSTKPLQMRRTSFAYSPTRHIMVWSNQSICPQTLCRSHSWFPHQNSLISLSFSRDIDWSLETHFGSAINHIIAYTFVSQRWKQPRTTTISNTLKLLNGHVYDFYKSSSVRETYSFMLLTTDLSPSKNLVKAVLSLTSERISTGKLSIRLPSLWIMWSTMVHLHKYLNITKACNSPGINYKDRLMPWLILITGINLLISDCILFSTAASALLFAWCGKCSNSIAKIILVALLKSTQGLVSVCTLWTWK